MPVINKIDLPNADIAAVHKQLEEILVASMADQPSTVLTAREHLVLMKLIEALSVLLGEDAHEEPRE